jgi:guanine nucleotide-binding protein subunit alpha, other
MGSCLSSPASAEVSETDKARHKEVEKQLREVSMPLRVGVMVVVCRNAKNYLSTGESKVGEPGQGALSLTPRFV